MYVFKKEGKIICNKNHFKNKIMIENRAQKENTIGCHENKYSPENIIPWQMNFKFDQSGSDGKNGCNRNPSEI